MRIKTKIDDQEFSFLGVRGINLLEQFKNNEIYVSSICGGVGTCHKCRIRVEDGFLPVRDIDKKAFSQEELSGGWRLSCQSIPKTNCTIKIPGVENLKLKPRILHTPKKLNHPVIVCDLGSTGVVMGLGDNYENKSAEAHLLNKQIRYGSDVMTRLHHAQRFGSEPLKKSILKTLNVCLKSLEESDKLHYDIAIKKPIMCSGNSAMTSFLHDLDIRTLAVSPFQPLHTHAMKSKCENFVFESPPLLGGFIGADTTAVLAYLESLNSPKPYMMIDIGTNTEIVSVSSNSILFTSTPAGPAFEGASITKGMRAEPGAISSLSFQHNKWNFETIENDIPKGICGSGLIDAVSEGLRHNFIEKDGLLKKDPMYFCEKVFLNMHDIREFQLAKSAIRTAVEMIFDRANEKPKKIYLAGNFAEKLNYQSVINVGMLPADISLETIGNASYKGSFVLANCTAKNRNEFYQKIRDQKKHLELALQDDFQEKFIYHLNFNEKI